MATLSPAKTPVASRLAALCRRLAEAQVDAYLVPSADTHLNEYVPAYQRRRAAISGFTGSAGDALISPAGSHLFVDSRYHVQAEHEVGLKYRVVINVAPTQVSQPSDLVQLGKD